MFFITELLEVREVNGFFILLSCYIKFCSSHKQTMDNDDVSSLSDLIKGFIHLVLRRNRVLFFYFERSKFQIAFAWKMLGCIKPTLRPVVIWVPSTHFCNLRWFGWLLFFIALSLHFERHGHLYYLKMINQISSI
jgi:hypothetical protein